MAVKCPVCNSDVVLDVEGRIFCNFCEYDSNEKMFKKIPKLICPCQVSEEEVEGTVWSDTLMGGIQYSKNSWHFNCEICERTFRLQDITEEINYIVKITKDSIDEKNIVIKK